MVDYTNEGFVIPIIADDAKGYASINSIMYREEDGLDIAGQYFVYMLHPTMGSTHFVVEHDNSYIGWKKDGGAFWVNDEIFQLIINAIEEKKRK